VEGFFFLKCDLEGNHDWEQRICSDTLVPSSPRHIEQHCLLLQAALLAEDGPLINAHH
jgi:hypothetical protein